MIPLVVSLGPGCGGTDEPGPPADSVEPAPAACGPLDRSIRVLLLDEIQDCRIAVKEPFDLQKADDGTELARGIALERISVEFRDGKIVFPQLRQAFDLEAVDLLPSGREPVAVEMDAGVWRQFRGSLRLLISPPAGGAVVNVVDVEDYLIGVVSAELPRWFHKETFIAQAIAARTYAWYQKRTAGTLRTWDVKATQSSQVYLGLDREALVPQAARAVRDTCGIVSTWSAPQGCRIFCTYYSSTCGGSTQAAGPVKNEPIIKPLEGNIQCDYCRDSPAYRWGPVRLDKSFITQQLRGHYPKFDSIGPIEQLEVTERTPTGRPVRLSLIDAEGRAIELEAENFRLVVNGAENHLKSTFFRPIIERDAIVFADGKGFGHGIGMCQYGAEGLAAKGLTAAKILRFYYPSSQLTRAY